MTKTKIIKNKNNQTVRSQNGYGFYYNEVTKDIIKIESIQLT